MLSLALVLLLPVLALASPLRPMGLQTGLRWWSHCPLLDMTHTLSNETVTYPLDNYVKYNFKLEPLVRRN